MLSRLYVFLLIVFECANQTLLSSDSQIYSFVWSGVVYYADDADPFNIREAASCSNYTAMKLSIDILQSMIYIDSEML